MDATPAADDAMARAPPAPSVEVGFAKKGPPALAAPRWTDWDGGKLGGRPVSGVGRGVGARPQRFP